VLMPEIAAASKYLICYTRSKGNESQGWEQVWALTACRTSPPSPGRLWWGRERAHRLLIDRRARDSLGGSRSQAATGHGITSQNHRITECSGLEGTSVGHLVQPSCRSRVTYSTLGTGQAGAASGMQAAGPRPTAQEPCSCFLFLGESQQPRPLHLRYQRVVRALGF